MTLLKARRTEGGITVPESAGLSSRLVRFGTALEWVQDRELRDAMIAAKINLLRREAPYLYVVANDGDEKPDTADAYVRAMERRELGRGVWLAHPDFAQDTRTTVTAVLLGDILPFVPCLSGDWYCLLCLPKPISLAEIDDVVTLSATVAESVTRLLAEGGCLLTCVDHTLLALSTFDTGYAKYFHHA